MANLGKKLKQQYQSDYNADLERKLGLKMNIEYSKLCDTLSTFKEDLDGFDTLLGDNE